MTDAAKLNAFARKALAALDTLTLDPDFEIRIEIVDKSDVVEVLKPFAGFANFAACVQKQKDDGHSEESARKICGALQRDTEKATEKSVTKNVRVFKTQEERYVLGIVLEPTLEMQQPDSQNDVYSAEEVRNAAYAFMQDYQQIGIQHTEKAGDRIKILESWIQREDATIDGQAVKAGSWLLGVRIVDDDLWAAVKAGDITGFSIGGLATRTPLTEKI